MSGTLRAMSLSVALRATCVFACGGLLAGCSAAPEKNNLVAQAYESSGVLTGVPYQRSIFSSTDF